MRCHRLVGAPESTRGLGRQVLASSPSPRRISPARVMAIQMPRRTSPHADCSSRRSNHRNINITNTKATTVATELIKNITPIQPTAPNSDKLQCTLNFGRNDGLPSRRSIPAVMFSTPYVVRKNMVSTGAMIFRFPNQTAKSAIISVSTVPRRGVSSSPSPRPSQRSQRGNTPSRASACRTLGAPRILPTALESVAPQTPMRIASPQYAISRIRSGFSTNVIASARFANTTTSDI